MTGLIILAAGESARLGRPKQLLQYKGETLIRRSYRAGFESGCSPVIVVLGAYADQIEPQINRQMVQIVYNHEWKEGMCSSIRSGVAKMMEMDPFINESIIMLCDQPWVEGTLLLNMIHKKRESGKRIVACAYEDTIGVPVLYERIFFSELLSLRGNKGAKRILRSHPDEVVTIPFPKGIIDIDTASDFKNLNSI